MMSTQEMIRLLEQAERDLKEKVDYFDMGSAQVGFGVADDLKRIREELEHR